MCLEDLSLRGGPTSNPRLDAAHSGVTALAQGRKRRATWRGRQAHRSADRTSGKPLDDDRS
jgi:hypothetical protein